MDEPNVTLATNFWCPMTKQACAESKCAWSTPNDDGEHMGCALWLLAMATNKLLEKR
jgi:hypothetical protein